MSFFLLIIYIAYIIYTLCSYYKKEYGVYQLPFLIACVNLTFVLPQMIAIYGVTENPDRSLSMTLFMIVSCNLAINIGFGLNRKLPLGQFASISFTNGSKLVIALFILVGFLAYMMNRGVYRGGMISGQYVIISFFVGFLQYALILCFLVYKRRIISKRTFWILASFVILVYLDKTFMTGRRNDAIRIILIVSYFIFYLSGNNKLYRKFRWFIPAFFILGMIGNTQIEEYRSNAYDDVSLGQNISTLDFSQAKNSLLSNTKGEVNNAVLGIENCYEHGYYDFGAYDWNRIIHDFVPQILVGSQGKKSLMISTPSQGLERKLTRTGSTMTGYYDAFASFGIFGFVKFLVIALFMGILWRMQERSDICKLMYFAMLVNTMHIVTHTTSYFSNALIFFLIFVSPFLVLVRKKV